MIYQVFKYILSIDPFNGQTKNYLKIYTFDMSLNLSSTYNHSSLSNNIFVKIIEFWLQSINEKRIMWCHILTILDQQISIYILHPL